MTASKEVILSGGTIGTPHILLHSGIGDKNDLARLGITSVIDLPSVGKNLTDHPFFTVNFGVNIRDDTDPWGEYVVAFFYYYSFLIARTVSPLIQLY